MSKLFEDLPLKLVSLGLAVVLWFAIAGEKSSERGLSVPVELENIPPGLEITTGATNSVELRVRASPGVIQRLGRSDVSVILDLDGIDEGEHIFHLTEQTVRRPFGITVVKISPSVLTMTLERSLVKSVPVRPHITGKPADGLEVAEVLSDPPAVRLAGPRSHLEGVAQAFTEAVSVNDASAAVVKTVNIGISDPLLRILDSPRVKVTARIQEVQQERRFNNLRLELRGGSFSVKPSQVAVTLHGSATALDQVRPTDILAYVEAGQAQPGAHRPIAVQIAPGHTGITVVKVAPAEAQLGALRPARP